jgi:hypothetical protein
VCVCVRVCSCVRSVRISVHSYYMIITPAQHCQHTITISPLCFQHTTRTPAHYIHHVTLTHHNRYSLTQQALLSHSLTDTLRHHNRHSLTPYLLLSYEYTPTQALEAVQRATDDCVRLAGDDTDGNTVTPKTILLTTVIFLFSPLAFPITV